MEIGAAGRHGRSKDKEINKTNEDKTGTKNQEEATRQSTTRTNKTKHNQQEDKSNIKNKDQQEDSHLAWNPDSRWAR
jgi:hypothetical protein